MLSELWNLKSIFQFFFRALSQYFSARWKWRREEELKCDGIYHRQLCNYLIWNETISFSRKKLFVHQQSDGIWFCCCEWIKKLFKSLAIKMEIRKFQQLFSPLTAASKNGVGEEANMKQTPIWLNGKKLLSAFFFISVIVGCNKGTKGGKKNC